MNGMEKFELELKLINCKLDNVVIMERKHQGWEQEGQSKTSPTQIVIFKMSGGNNHVSDDGPGDQDQRLDRPQENWNIQEGLLTSRLHVELT